MNRQIRLSLVGLLLVAVLGVGAGTVTATPEFSSNESPGASIGEEARFQVNNSTAPHRNPANYSQRGDLDSLSGWFERSLGSRLEESAISLSKGEYDRARELVGDDFNEDLRKFVEVAGETGGDSDDTASEEMDKTEEKQEELIEETERYRELESEYRDAKNQGNQTRAREIAREMNEVANRINETSAEVIVGYQNLSSVTGTDFESTIGAIDELAANITRSAATIRKSEFIHTSLTIQTQAVEGSYMDPIILSGEVQTDNGSAVGPADGRIIVEGATVTRFKISNGSFTATVRPKLLERGEQSLNVSFQPTGSSPYLGSSASLMTDIRPVSPQLRANVSSETVQFGDEINIEGTLSVNHSSVSDIPIRVGLNGRLLGSLITDTEGKVEISYKVPTNLPTGVHRITLEQPRQNLAIGEANATATFSVQSTPTTLVVSSTSNGSEPRIAGSLETTDGRPVPNQQLAVLVNGSTIGYARTNAEGVFDTQLEFEGSESGIRDVTLQYDADGTNLEPSTATTAIQLTGSGGPGFSLVESQWLIGGALVAFAVVLFVGSRWRQLTGTETETAGSESALAAEPMETADNSSAAVVLDPARRYLERSHPDAAVITGYWVIRDRLTREGTEDGLTHWEFFREMESDGMDPSNLTLFRELTEAYERAAFAPGGLSTSEAEESLTAGEELLG